MLATYQQDGHGELIQPTVCIVAAAGFELLACTAHLDAATAPRANPNVGM